MCWINPTFGFALSRQQAGAKIIAMICLIDRFLKPWILLAFCLLGAVTTLAGSISGYADGIGTMAMISTTYELGWDDLSSAIYFCDFNNRFLRKVTVATGLVSTVLGSGFAGESDGTGTIVTLNQPYDVVSVGGSLYFTGSATVRKVTFSAGTGRRNSPSSPVSNFNI